MSLLTTENDHLTYICPPPLPESKRRKLDRYDHLLGSSKVLTYGITAKRYELYTEDNICHTKIEFVNELEKLREPNGMIFNIVARIPLISFDLDNNLDLEDINALFDDLVEEITQLSGLQFRLKRRIRKDIHLCRNATYDCKQAINPKSRHGSHSNVAQFNCEGSLQIILKKDYGFVEIIFEHNMHHALLPIIPVPEGLEEYIKDHECVKFSHLIERLKSERHFKDYVCQPYAGVRSRIRTIWEREVASQWTRDNNALESARLLLTSGDMSYLFPLTLERHAAIAVRENYIAFEIIYTGFDKMKFTSAAIDGTYHLTNTLQQCHAIVAEYEGEGYPIAMLFCGKNGITQTVIQSFVKVVIRQGYKFNYFTTDGDYRNTNAISAIYSRNKCQLCTWHIFKNIRNYERNEKINLSDLQSFLGTLEWFNEEEFHTILQSLTEAGPRLQKAVKDKTIGILRKALRDNPIYYARLESIHNENYRIRYNRSAEELYNFYFKKLYDYVVKENHDIYFFAYLYEKLLVRSRFQMASAVFKECIPRMSNMLVEAYFKTLKHNDLFRLRSMRIDTVIYIINSKIDQHFLKKLLLRSNPDRLFADIATSPPSWMKKMISTINKEIKRSEGSSNTSNVNFVTNMELFLCNCGHQKKNPHRLCRHLIQGLIHLYGSNSIKHFIYGCQRRETLPFIISPFSAKKVTSINGIHIPEFINSFPLTALHNRVQGHSITSDVANDEFLSDDQIEDDFLVERGNEIEDSELSCTDDDFDQMEDNSLHGNSNVYQNISAGNMDINHDRDDNYIEPRIAETLSEFRKLRIKWEELGAEIDYLCKADPSYLEKFVTNNRGLTDVFKYIKKMEPILTEAKSAREDCRLKRFNDSNSNGPPTWYTGKNWSRYQKLGEEPLTQSEIEREQSEIEREQNQIESSYYEIGGYDSDISMTSEEQYS